MNSIYKKIIRNYLAYYTGLVTPSPIGYVAIGVTYACQAKCTMCNIWRKYRENPSQFHEELSLPDLFERIERSRILRNVPGVGITGGEPFLKKGLSDFLINLATKTNIETISINTNALLPELISKTTRETIERFPKEKRLSVTLSIDAIDKTYERIRGVEGGFTRVSQTISLFKDIAREYDNLQVQVGCVVQPNNIHEIGKLENFCKEKDIPLGYMLAMDSHVLQNFDTGQTVRKFDQDALNALLELNKKMCILGLEKWISNSKKRPLRCFAGFSSIYIDPFGDVYPCVTMANNKDFLMGNIANMSIDDVWKSREAWKKRRRVKKCMYTDCWSGCEINQSTIQYSLLERVINKLSFGKLSYYKMRKLL